MEVKEALTLKQKNAASTAEPINIDDEVNPRIHTMVFNPSDGELKKLTVNFAKRVGSLDHIYGIINKT